MSALKKTEYSIGKSNNFDIRLLNVFVEVVRHGGLTQAQEALNISLSSISTYIRDLEIRLGLKLCNRGRGGFTLTQNGQAVYEHALQLFSSVESFNEQVANLKGKLSGELQIGIIDNSTMSPDMRLHDVIHLFTDEHPDVHIRVKIMSSDEIEAELLNGNLGLGIGIYPNTNKELRTLMKFPVTVDLYCGSQHPLFNKQDVKVADLANVAFARGCYAPDIGYLHGILPPPTAFSYFSEGLGYLIMSGRYVGYLPRRYSANWVATGEMRALPEKLFSHQMDVSAMVQRGQSVSPIMEAFLEKFESSSVVPN